MIKLNAWETKNVGNYQQFITFPVNHFKKKDKMSNNNSMSMYGEEKPIVLHRFLYFN